MDTHELEGVVETLPHPRVLIVGDLILDRYVTGDVSRISPEAPIPILTVQRSEERLGGAGNVAANNGAGTTKYEAVIKETSLPGRAAAKEAEIRATLELKDAGNSLSKQQLPPH